MAGARLKDVAEQAGVSIKTVSNVVRGEIRVAAATRLRVLAAIEALDYRPNAAARRLRTGRSGVISLAVPDLASPYFAELATFVIAEAKALALTVLIEQTGGDPEEEYRIASGGGQEIDGVILSPLRLPPERLARREHRLPLVLLGEREYDVPTDHVLIDNVAAAREVTAHLLSAGRRRPAALGFHEPASATARQRLHGFRLALKEAGLPYDPRLVPSVTDMTRARGRTAMRALLDSPGPRPDAVFCFNDRLAHGALRALHDAGLRVPDDIAVAGFDDTEESSYSVPSLTAIAPDKSELARLAVDALLIRISDPAELPHTVLRAPYTLRVRESTGGRPGPA